MLPQIEQAASLDAADDFVHEADSINFGPADLAKGQNEIVLKKSDLMADDAGRIIVRNSQHDNFYLICPELPTAFGQADEVAKSSLGVNHYYLFSDGTKIFSENAVNITLG